MRSDRYTKVVLTVIAFGLWTLTITQLGMPAVMAASGQPAAIDLEVPGGRARTEVAAPALAGPLRWTVGYAAAWDAEYIGGNECSTAVTLLSSAPSNVAVDVLFINKSGATVGTASFSLAPSDPHSVLAHEGGGNTWPLEADSYPSTGFFTGGFARVYADDPRVLATAFLMCKESEADGVSSSDQKVLSVANIPAYPAGATAEFFVAGMPATWMPPMAEVPE